MSWWPVRYLINSNRTLWTLIKVYNTYSINSWHTHYLSLFFNTLNMIYTRTQISQMFFYLYPDLLKLVATHCGCVKLCITDRNTSVTTRVGVLFSSRWIFYHKERKILPCFGPFWSMLAIFHEFTFIELFTVLMNAVVYQTWEVSCMTLWNVEPFCIYTCF